jgi:hypothetical protein
MIQSIYDCSCQWKNQKHCRLSPSCKGWGCRFLSTPIEEIPATIQEKAKLFSRVYREAKQKGVLECPHYRSIFIDEVLANLPKGEVCTALSFKVEVMMYCSLPDSLRIGYFFYY